MLDEILFWKNNVIEFNLKKINTYSIPFTVINSDASNESLASVFDIEGKKVICHRTFNEFEKLLSSTWREMEAIHYTLCSCKSMFANKEITWYTDNYACSIIVKKGSNKTHLQTLALRIFEILFENNINLNIFWIPRNLNVLADKYSKEIDFDDWVISNVLFID